MHQKYDPLLKELRAIPNPSSLQGKPRSENVSSAASFAAAVRDLTQSPPLDGPPKGDNDDDEDDDDDDDDDEEGSNDQITTSEAVRMIRELLQGTKRANALFKKEPEIPTPASSAAEDAAFVGSTPSAFAEEESSDSARGAADGLKGLVIESSDLWMQTSPETAVGEPETSHHVTPHVEHEVVVEEVAANPVPPEPPLFENRNDKVCRLADHRIPAGCTAVVALVVKGRLIVANAGDSRGVLCRAGAAVELSFDHKPQHVR